MTPAFQDDATAPGRRIWRKGHKGAVASIAVALFIGLIAIALLIAGIVALFTMPTVRDGMLAFLILGAAAAGAALLVAYVWRDGQGKRGMTIAIDAAGLILKLPAGRSLIHRPPACDETVPLSSIRAIETRLEGYRSMGQAMMQRPYRLVCVDRPPIFLFEERALGTAYRTVALDAVATELASRAGIPLLELPMAEGRGGILGVWFTRPPDWAAQAMTPAAGKRLVNRIHLTAAVAGIAVVLVLIALLF